MQPAPAKEKPLDDGRVLVQGRIEQLLVRWRNHDQREGDHCTEEDTTCGPKEMRPDQPCRSTTQKADCRQRCLHDSRPLVAGTKLGYGQTRAALHPCRMFDEGDIDGSPGEQACRQRGYKLKSRFHRILPPQRSERLE